MPSAASINFAGRLEVVDRIVEAYGLLGRRQRPALVKAGIVFLSAATEAFIEELYQEAAFRIFAGMSEKEFKALFALTSERLHNASVMKTELLYINLGMRGALRGLSWQGFANEKLRREWDAFFTMRNRVVHGANVSVPFSHLRRWRVIIETVVPIFEEKVANHTEVLTHRRPW